MIRTAHFNRKRFNKSECEEWSRRTGSTVLRITYTPTKARVVYRGKLNGEAK